MKFLLITNMYPKEGNLYRNAFIHSRVIQYKKSELEIEIFVLTTNIKLRSYFFEGIKVVEGNEVDLLNILNANNYSKLLVHFLNREMMNVFNKMNNNIPLIVWIHGTEALGWYRRLWLLSYYGLDFIKYIKHNTRQMLALRNLINDKNKKNIKFIFVSNWMKQITEKDTFTKVKNYQIIPNYIDSDLFNFKIKSPELRKKILLIRSFETKKYANDVSVKAIIELSKKDYFRELEISIYGDGKDFIELTKPLIGFPNVKVSKGFLLQHEIAQKHKEHGVFLCPTRQDSQGVSMCEAMASGLVPITTNNTAIPEFVKDKISGFLTNSPFEIVEKIEKLYRDANLFQYMSLQASSSINNICNPTKILSEELRVILQK